MKSDRFEYAARNLKACATELLELSVTRDIEECPHLTALMNMVKAKGTTKDPLAATIDIVTNAALARAAQSTSN